MANKRYDEFAAGTPSGSRLILHADPSTGDLEKATIAELPFSPSGLLFAKSSFINANNSGSNPQSISTITVPANTITSNGDWFEWDIFFTFLTASGSKSIDFAIDGNTTGNFNSTGQFEPWVKIKAAYKGSNQLIRSMQIRNFNSNIGSSAWDIITFDPTAARDLKAVITAGAANDIKMLYQTVAIYKA
jgi:hypothetical protein